MSQKSPGDTQRERNRQRLGDSVEKGKNLPIPTEQPQATPKQSLGQSQASNGTTPRDSKQAKKVRYHLLTAAEATQGNTLEWKFKNLLPSVGVGQVSGQSRAGKTFVLLSMAEALADGAYSWFGFKIPKACPVVYVCLEGEAGFRRRIQALEQFREEEKKPPLPDSLRFVIYEDFAINKKADVDDLAKVCPKGALVIVDTQNASAPFIDENTSQGIGEVIAGAKALSKAIGGFVLLVAHEGLNAQGRPRGSSAQIPAWDTFISVSKSGDNRYWQGLKVKDAEETKKFGFRLRQVGLGHDEDDDPIISCVALPCDSQTEDKPLTKSEQYGLESLKKAIEQNMGKPVGIEVWRPVFYEGHTADTTDKKRVAFNRVRDGLASKKAISVHNDVYAIADQADLAGFGSP